MNIDKLKEPYVLILIGPPLSGKSTWINKNFSDKEVTVISRDQLVLDVYGEDDYNAAFKNVDQKKVNRLLEQSFVDANDNKENVIVDMTNMTSKRRRTTLNNFDDDYTKIAVIFPILDWDEFIKRNKKRELEENKTIPEHLLKNMISSYQPINKDEGFDKVVSL
jgi:tRNA uridine 5-carbamoylmethylation protein Kti12